MAIIVTRAGKGSGLTNAEIDANFTNLNADNFSPVRLNPRRITANLAISSDYNAASVGPITVSDGITVTVGDNATWSIH